MCRGDLRSVGWGECSGRRRESGREVESVGENVRGRGREYGRERVWRGDGDKENVGGYGKNVEDGEVENIGRRGRDSGRKERGRICRRESMGMRGREQE